MGQEALDTQELKNSHQDPIELKLAVESSPGILCQAASKLDAAHSKSYGVFDDLQEVSLHDNIVDQT